MTTLQEAAMRKALEALETCSYGDYSSKHVVDPSFDGDAVEAAIESLKAALAQQGEQRCAYCDGTGDVHGIDGEWRGSCPCAAAPAPQPAQGGLEKLRAPLIQWHQNMAEVCRDSDGAAYLNHRDTAALLLQSAQPVAQPLTVDGFEEWHKAVITQALTEAKLGE